MSESNLDMLITRVIDHRAGPGDWVELEALAAREPSVWRELAMAQKDEAALSAAVNEAVAVAERVGTPDGRRISEAALRRRIGQAAMWGGWAAAATVAMVFMTQRATPVPSTPVQTAGMASLPLPQMLSNYIDQGKKEGTVVGELPDKIVLDSVKTPDGRTEIVFVRQIVERTRVDDLYRMSTDEAGNVTPVKVRLTVKGRKSAT